MRDVQGALDQLEDYLDQLPALIDDTLAKLAHVQGDHAEIADTMAKLAAADRDNVMRKRASEPPKPVPVSKAADSGVNVKVPEQPQRQWDWRRNRWLL